MNVSTTSAHGPGRIRPAFQTPDAVRIGANRMLPVAVMVVDASEPQQGRGIVAYHEIPANRPGHVSCTETLAPV